MNDLLIETSACRLVILSGDERICMILTRICYMILLGSHESVAQMTSRSVQPFFHSTPVCQTHRQTDRRTDTLTTLRPKSVTIGCFIALRSGDAAYKF